MSEEATGEMNGLADSVVWLVIRWRDDPGWWPSEAVLEKIGSSVMTASGIEENLVLLLLLTNYYY